MEKCLGRGKCLGRHKLPKPIQEKVDNAESSLSIKEIKVGVKNHSKKDILKPVVSLCLSKVTEEIIPILCKLFLKIGNISNSFYKACETRKRHN